ncbi:WhiB family transcriptional regulator [Nocardioides pocheonensis]|uniref:Transcriptional regulator WhiB n=1 Tax=Nocardioides pocheonensis TaxID=661485 RepID=A0A3N0GJ97_9ACTN|nr:WhiB family transcriptional regulator [Nocardioides pocheonensis]RNM12242.1 WhiB family transcriptional regulator [Nocardioides pocheonensis]
MPRLRDGRDWTVLAACLDEDPDLFFPAGERGAAPAQLERARKICQSCPVRGWCLQLALRIDADHGMWGGTTPHERQRFKSRSRR